MGAASILFYVGLTAVSENVLGDSIAAVGLMIAFYYGITGFACVWFYGRELTHSVRNLFMRGVLPGLGGLLLLSAFVKSAYDYAQPDYGNTTILGIGGVFVVGIGGLLLGGVLMLVYSRIAPAYFHNETLVRGTSDPILAGTGRTPTLGPPDTTESVVVAPDLSNLPPKATTEQNDDDA